MKRSRKTYQNGRWHQFADQVKSRDQFTCLSCGRNGDEVILQVHHQIYRDGKLPWDYALSDCITLCKGCHSQRHGLIEPSRGWILDSIEDLGDLVGICERKSCGNPIRHGYNIYHPAWGYKTVGSTCVEYLTQEEKDLGHAVIKVFERISQFISEAQWWYDRTKNGKAYMVAKHAHHLLRIYGEENHYAFQIALKEKGVKWYDFKEEVNVPNKPLEQVKEMGFIVLKGLLTKDKEEREILRNIYKRLL